MKTLAIVVVLFVLFAAACDVETAPPVLSVSYGADAVYAMTVKSQPGEWSGNVYLTDEDPTVGLTASGYIGEVVVAISNREPGDSAVYEIDVSAPHGKVLSDHRAIVASGSTVFRVDADVPVLVVTVKLLGGGPVNGDLKVEIR